MNFLLNSIKVIIYSNLLVSLCVGAYTHLTFLLFELQSDASFLLCLMVFCFTFTTYNGQRIFRLQKYHDLGERLQWVVKYKTVLTFLSLLTGITGLLCAYYLGVATWLVLLITGFLSLFYVVPIPLLKKALRHIPYVKVFVIALVWSVIIVGLPFANAKDNFKLTTPLLYGALSCFCFIVAITLPFDVRDMKYDQQDGLKTLPQLLNVKGTVVISQTALLISFVTLWVAQIESNTLFGLGIGYGLTALILSFTSGKRGELFFAGWVESTVLIIWLSTWCTIRFFPL